MSKKASGIIICVCGGQNVGKSAWIIEQLNKSNRKIFVYDKRGEYLNRLSPASAARATVFYLLSNFKRFLLSFSFSNIIFEEATTFLRGYTDDQVVDLLTGIYHNGNIAYFPFHTVRGIPLTVLDLCTFIVIFPTGEDLELLKRDRPALYKAMSLNKGKSPFIYQNQPFRK